MECYVKGVMMQAGYDQTWLESDDLKIVCIYARHAVRFGVM
jgi:hypothetical protein